MDDVLVVGGGILGLATARHLLQRHRGLAVTVLEKEDGPARHQTGRNSGVVHSGVYYRPGSLKATLAVAGNRSMLELCRHHGIAHDVRGKLIAASDDREAAGLAELAERGRANGIDVSIMSPAEAAEREPHLRCTAALWVPTAAVVDFSEVARAMAADVVAAGGRIVYGAAVSSLRRVRSGWRARTRDGDHEARRLVTCAGLHADRLARMAGADPGVRIVPFRGEYHELRPERSHLVRGLIYPVPDMRFPFLGVHLTRDVHDRVHAGPNAVLALAREGYRWGDVSRADLAETLRYRGTWRLARRHWRTGISEVHRSLRRSRFVRSARRLVPELHRNDLVPAPAGVRAQAVAPDGSLLDDFHLVSDDGAVHVVNAPSPAATASLEIARIVTDRLLGG